MFIDYLQIISRFALLDDSSFPPISDQINAKAQQCIFSPNNLPGVFINSHSGRVNTFILFLRRVTACTKSPVFFLAPLVISYLFLKWEIHNYVCTEHFVRVFPYWTRLGEPDTNLDCFLEAAE